MKLLVDENIGYRVINFLRLQKHDVMSVLEKLKGEKDKVILKLAITQERTIITYDKDFGNLVFNLGFEHKGIILLRTKK